MVQLSHPYMTTGKNIALTRQTFVGKVMSLLFNTLSRFVIVFLPRSKRLLISWLQSPSAMILEASPNEVCHCFHCFPIYLPWSDGTGCHDLSFQNVECVMYGNPLQYSCLENSMGRGAWQAVGHGVAKELDMTWQLTTTNDVMYSMETRANTSVLYIGKFLRE